MRNLPFTREEDTLFVWEEDTFLQIRGQSEDGFLSPLPLLN